MSANQSSEMYPSSFLWTNVAELLHELNLPYEVRDVKSFGYLPEEGVQGAVFIEVLSRDADGKKTGTIRHTRWVERDIPFAEWGNPPA